MENHTSEQVEIIRAAIKKGRDEMLRRNPDNTDPLVFADAFNKAGEIQAPGRPITQDKQRYIGTHVLHSLTARGIISFGSEPDWVQNICRREMNRAYSEAYWTGAMTHEEVTDHEERGRYSYCSALTASLRCTLMSAAQQALYT